MSQNPVARLNRDMSPPEVRDHCQGMLEPATADILKAAARRLLLSARTFHRVLKLSRTIADLGSSDLVRAAHVAEALQYREREG